MQIAFDLDFADPRTGSAVPWAEASWALLKVIAEAPWKIVDTETTELTLIRQKPRPHTGAPVRFV